MQQPLATVIDCLAKHPSTIGLMPRKWKVCSFTWGEARDSGEKSVAWGRYRGRFSSPWMQKGNVSLSAGVGAVGEEVQSLGPSVTRTLPLPLENPLSSPREALRVHFPLSKACLPSLGESSS